MLRFKGDCSPISAVEFIMHKRNCINKEKRKEKVSGIAHWLECWTHVKKVVGSNLCRSSGIIFFSRVSFLC